MGRISNTWNLAKTSWGVLKKDRELMLLPVLSFLACVAVILVAIAVSLLTSSVSFSSDDSAVVQNPAIIVVGLLGSLAVGCVSVFFNGALVAGAHERLTGGDPTVASAIRRAFQRIGGLLPWALITTTVGLVLQALRERAGWLGRIVVAIVEMAWDVVTFLTVPAIVIDDMGPVEGLKRSASLLRSTWGENIASQVGFGLLGFLLALPAVLVLVVVLALGSAVLAFVGIVAALAWMAVVIVVMTTLNAIFQTALYLYATTGRSPSGFEQAPLSQSFRVK